MEWFGMEMTSRILIRIRNWKKAFASWRYGQSSELYHQFELTLTQPFHECKVFNFIKINESLEWFGLEMTSRILIKQWNWKNASASLRYDQLSELYHKFELTLTHSFNGFKVFNFVKINESLESFGREMTSKIRNQNQKSKESICIIKIWPINWVIPQFWIEYHTPFP